MRDGILAFIGMFLVLLLLCVMGIIILKIENDTPDKYQYINTEHNKPGLTTYTMIYLYNGEVKYFYYDDPDSEYIFRKITGMIEE